MIFYLLPEYGTTQFLPCPPEHAAIAKSMEAGGHVHNTILTVHRWGKSRPMAPPQTLTVRSAGENWGQEAAALTGAVVDRMCYQLQKRERPQPLTVPGEESSAALVSQQQAPLVFASCWLTRAMSWHHVPLCLKVHLVGPQLPEPAGLGKHWWCCGMGTKNCCQQFHSTTQQSLVWLSKSCRYAQLESRHKSTLDSVSTWIHTLGISKVTVISHWQQNPFVGSLTAHHWMYLGTSLGLHHRLSLSDFPL